MNTVVIVLNWNGWDDTRVCLRSLSDAGHSADVWVLDNGSDQECPKGLRTDFDDVRIISLTENHGWAGGNNRALKIASIEGYELAYLINNDCIVSPGFLQPLVSAAIEDPRFAAVGSQIAYMDAPMFARFDGEYHWPGEQTVTVASGVRVVSEANGAGMLVRLRAAEAAGYFDERFFIYHEEREWCWRVRRQGWLVGFCPASVVHHRVRATNTSSNAVYYRVRNEFLLLDYETSSSRSTPSQRAVYRALLTANRARQRCDSEQWQAAVCGLYDALHGRFGRRTTHVPDRKFQYLVRCWTWLAKVQDKLRCVRGSLAGLS